jgi:hypothetical protein
MATIVETYDDAAILAMVKERGATFKSLVIQMFKDNADLVRDALETFPAKEGRSVKKERTPEQKAAANQARLARKEYFDAFELDHTEEEIAAEVKRYNAELRKNRRELQKRVTERKASDSESDEPLGSAF